ncbi:MAG: class I SAM-dependent methyltransferase [Burkholderiales bacterium]|nr:class I SAM-dependent methyltransferase [Burkholderiales bacterium]
MDIYNESYGNFVGSENGYSAIRNKLRTNKFAKIVNPQKDESILDIGCNKGLLLYRLIPHAKEVIGIDINEKLVSSLKDEKIKFMSATNLKFAENSFDKVCAFEVIEHIEEIDKVFSEASRVLKNGGKFIVSFPFEMVRGQSAILDALFVYKDISYARKLHVHKLTPNKIKKIVKNLPLRTTKTQIVLIPFPSFLMILEKTD